MVMKWPMSKVKSSLLSDGKASAYNEGDPGSIPGLGRSLEKEMAIYSSILAWKTTWMEEHVRLQSMGSRIGHD